MLRKKPQLSDTIKIITITSSSWGWGVVGSGGGVPYLQHDVYFLYQRSYQGFYIKLPDTPWCILHRTELSIVLNDS